MLKQVSISDLKKNCEKLFKKLENGEESCLVVMENGRPLAVIMSWKHYRGLREALALAEPDLATRVKKALEERKQGQLMTSEGVKKKIGLPLTKKEKEMLKRSKKDLKNRRFKKLT